jgi:penicillin-binding protein 1A
LTVVLIVLVVLAGAGGAGVVLWGMHHYGRGLPDYGQLADYRPPTLSRFHAGDGRLLAEYASEKRVFVPIDAMPKIVIKAFVAAEDKNFYDHLGIDVIGITRAAIQNLENLGSRKRLIGASTITQQVAKNFLLTNEVSIERKIKEALLAVRIERALSKDRILELYLNEIFLGQRSYGVAAAAMNYFDKSLDELDLVEIAFIAGLPKAPNNYHPVRKPEAAVERRNYVLRRMAEDSFITEAAMRAAMAAPIEMRDRDRSQLVTAPFFAEEVRREIAERYGEDSLYEGGLSVRATVDPRLQAIADRALRAGLTGYDRRHGWRGPVARIELDGDWRRRLAGVIAPPGLSPWRLAAVLEVGPTEARIGLADGPHGRISLAELTWARSWQENQRLGPEVRRPDQVLAPGDVVAVERLADIEDAAPSDPAHPVPPAADEFGLRQVPDVEGAVVAMDPHTGRVLAMAGGWSFAGSQFNRATQAHRQPGSAFKPFVYLAALEHGYTPASLILDAPFAIDQGPGLGMWKPQNYSHDFYGPATLRVGVEKSRNVMTVRLASTLGIDQVQQVARRFDIGDYPANLSVALGAGETSLIRLTAAYAMLVNGGKYVAPALIERIQDRNGRTIYRRDRRICKDCRGLDGPAAGVPRLADIRAEVTDPATAFQITWVLKGVIERGTGRRIAALGRPLAGKTGTTNDSFDTWFLGFAPDLVVGAFVGFDQPRTLGPRQTGSNVAAPIFKRIMAEALGGTPPAPFRVPRGIRMVRIDADTGRLPGPATKRVILEAFKPGTEPTAGAPLAGGRVPGAPTPGAIPAADRGLY